MADDPRGPEGDVGEVEAGPNPPTRPGSVRSIRKGKLREALFGRPAPEDRLGRYELRDVLGRGGMGTVVEAYDPTLRRTVALKLLHHDLAESYGRRLLEEARALARVSHPNVVHVHETGHIDGRAFIAMELVRGDNLHAWQKQARPWTETVDAYRQAGRGLAAAHAAGLVHRDFKPSNCMIDPSGRVRVLDFGLVRDLHRGQSTRSTHYPPSPQDSMRLVQTLTRTGAVVGTLVYMSPEQLCGRAVDARSDQFSFCAALYEALYGVRPFDGKSIGELLSAVMGSRPPTAPRGTRVPARVRKAILRGMAREPEQRWPSMDALLLELQRPRRSRWWLVGGGAAILVTATVATWSREVPQRHSPGCQPQDRQALHRVWDDEHRSRVHRALVDPGLAYGTHAWQQASHRLDRIAERWTLRVDAICDARADPTTPPTRTERLECLGRVRTSFEETVTILAEGDAGLVSRATTLVTALPQVTDCDSPGDGPEASVRARAAHREATQLEQRGDLAQAQRLLEQALEDLEQVHRDDPIHPEMASAHARLARVQVQRGQLDDAIGHYHHALVRGETLLGPQHPALGVMLVELAQAERARLQPRAAHAFARRAVALSPPTDDSEAAALAQARRLLAETKRPPPLP